MALLKPTIPHFSLPFRVLNVGYGVAAVENEQGTIEDIADCVELSIRTPRGFRIEAPDFGVTDQTFTMAYADVDMLKDEVVKDEPRALLESEDIADADQLVQRILLKVGGSRESGGVDV